MDDNSTPATKADISELREVLNRIEKSHETLTDSVDRNEARNTTLQSMMTDLAKNLSAFQKSVEQRFDKVDERMERIEGRIDQANERISEVLNVACNIDRRLSETFSDHDRRIQRLERHVGLSA